MLARQIQIQQRRIGFNPRPPFPGGDAAMRFESGNFWRFQSTPPVSGRRCDEEKTQGQPDQIVSIHAPRFREAMQPDHHRRQILRRFQSTPPVSGRRCTLNDANAIRQLLVSIHAPRFREAMPMGGNRLLPYSTVSIHAPRFREAMRGSGDF